MTATIKVTALTRVEVQSQVENVNTTDATTGESLGSITIAALPLATRNFQHLLALSAGASSDSNNASQLGRGAVYIHVNGGREDNNNYLIDGISVADYAFGELTYTPLPNPDSIQEFKVSTSLYDASQGRNGGGNINATLKGGTSSLHEDLWEYFRNTSLDATDYFLKKVVIQQNIFGGDFFKISEAKNLRFRTDFFNLFNHPSFANPPLALVAAPGPGSPAVRSAPISSVVGTPRG